MDWTKAKTILIVALIITNIFLIANYVSIKTDIEVTSSDVIDDTIHLINEKNIYFYGKIPSKEMEMPVLEVEYDEYNKNKVNQLMNEQSPAFRHITKEEAIMISNDFLKKCNLLDDNMRLEPIQETENGYMITYKNYYDEILIEECYMNVTIENGIITSLERLWVNPIAYRKNKKSTIPATNALLKFASMQEQRDKVIQITSIDMVYWLDTSIFGMDNTSRDTAFPAWKICYNIGETKYTKYIRAYKD